MNGAAADPIFEYLKTQAPTEEYKGLKAKAAKAQAKAQKAQAKAEKKAKKVK